VVKIYRGLPRIDPTAEPSRLSGARLDWRFLVAFLVLVVSFIILLVVFCVRRRQRPTTIPRPIDEDVSQPDVDTVQIPLGRLSLKLPGVESRRHKPSRHVEIAATKSISSLRQTTLSQSQRIWNLCILMQSVA